MPSLYKTRREPPGKDTLFSGNVPNDKPSGNPDSPRRPRAPEASTSNGGRGPALAKVKVRVAGSSTPYTMVTNFPLGKSSTIKRFSLVSTSAGVEQASASERNMPRVADISSAAAVPLPETSASTSPQSP